MCNSNFVVYEELKIIIKTAWRSNLGGGAMLILTRRVGESLRIGDDVSVTVLGIKGSQVRLGVNAPKSVSVHREEVYDRINDENSKNSGENTKTSEKNVNL